MRAEQNAHAQPPQLSGKHETPASSLNWAISLGNDWLGGMFGTDEDGVSYVRQVIIRENADFKVVKTNPVVLSLNTRQLPVEKIKILRSGRPVDDPMEVDRLANEIERSWKSRPRVLPAQRTAAAPQPRPRVAVIAGPGEEAERGGTSGRVVFVKLDRDCKSYSVAELMELVETLQSALRESDVVPLGKREGCVEIGLRISAEEAEQFLWLVRSGALEEFGVIDGDLIPVENEAEFLTSLRALEIQAAIGCPLVLWTVAARRRLRQALAEAIGRRQPDAFATTMTDFTSRLRRLFPEARAIVVQDQYVGFRRREDEFILLVEIEGGHRPGRHLVKLASPERLAAELAAWESCRPYGLRHDLVFMTLEPGNADGPPDGLVYGDAQQFLGDVPAVYLETAFLGAVRHGSPSPAAVADTLVQLYERIGHLLYRQSFVDDPADADFVLKVPRLGESLPVWSQPESEPARVRQDVNTWASAEAGWFRDPVDYLQFVCRCVPWQGGVSPGDGSPVIPPPERWGDAPAVSELVPRMLRGCGHGDLHGRNVLVAIVRERARWPAVFDYEHMGPANLLAWDFVKMEVELKVRAYTALFAGRRADAFIRAVQEFEVELARQTEECQGGRSWPEVADRAPPHERLWTLLLTLRRQAALHLGIDAGRPSREWLDEYYFALTAYGVHAGRFPGLGRPNLLAGYVSAGVACARFLLPREDRLAGGRALSAEKPS